MTQNVKPDYLLYDLRVGKSFSHVFVYMADWLSVCLSVGAKIVLDAPKSCNYLHSYRNYLEIQAGRCAVKSKIKLNYKQRIFIQPKL